jgi:catechol 2,3-dioxygenase-like lactoylglutathione lyase family enzyme
MCCFEPATMFLHPFLFVSKFIIAQTIIMELKRLSPILWTKDLPASIKFYTDVPGFSARSNFPNFASMQKGNVEIMLVEPVEEPEDCKDPQNKEPFFEKARLTGSIYITVTGVDDLWASVKDRAVIESYIADREYRMRDFSILDNNGYEIVFGENI